MSQLSHFQQQAVCDITQDPVFSLPVCQSTAVTESAVKLTKFQPIPPILCENILGVCNIFFCEFLHIWMSGNCFNRAASHSYYPPIYQFQFHLISLNAFDRVGNMQRVNHLLIFALQGLLCAAVEPQLEVLATLRPWKSISHLSQWKEYQTSHSKKCLSPLPV